MRKKAQNDVSTIPTSADAAEAFEENPEQVGIENPIAFGQNAAELALINKILNHEQFTNFVNQLSASNPQAAAEAKKNFEDLATSMRQSEVQADSPELISAMQEVANIVPATFREQQFNQFFTELAEIRDNADVQIAAGEAAKELNNPGTFERLMAQFQTLYSQLQMSTVQSYAPYGAAPLAAPIASGNGPWRRTIAQVADMQAPLPPSPPPPPDVQQIMDQGSPEGPLDAGRYESLEQLVDSLINMGPYQSTYKAILAQVDDEDQDSAKAAVTAFFQGFPEGACTLYSILVKAGLAEPLDKSVVERLMEKHPQLADDDKNDKVAKHEGLFLPPVDSSLRTTAEASDKIEKLAAGSVGGPSPAYYTHGPGENRYCPKLRNTVSTYVCRYHCLDGLPVDDHQVLCGEAIWRQAVMDKFSREYKDADGNWVGGYLNKRFEIERSTHEHPYQLKPGQRHAPINEDAWSFEKRLQEMRRSEGSKREYSETPGDPKDLYNWDPYEFHGGPKSPELYEKKRDSIAKNASSWKVQKTALNPLNPGKAGAICPNCGGNLGPEGPRANGGICPNCGANTSQAKTQTPMDYGATPKDDMLRAPAMAISEHCGIFCASVGDKKFYSPTKEGAIKKAQIAYPQTGTLEEENDNLSYLMESQKPLPARKPMAPSWRPQKPQPVPGQMDIDPTPSTKGRPPVENLEPEGVLRKAPEVSPEEKALRRKVQPGPHIDATDLEKTLAADVLMTDDETAKERDKEAERAGI